jgi:molybdate transport repressor ModE-like protein
MTVKFRSTADWEDVRVFVALARHGSLSAAARALAVTHATVARRIASLEATLGCRLVERRTDGYVLTGDGQRALTAASEMEAASFALLRSEDHTQHAALVRVNTTTSLARSVLIPWLASHAAGQAGLDIEIVTDSRIVSLERHETDIALRLGRPEDGAIVARQVAEIGFGFYANRDWIARLDSGVTPVFVGFDEAHAHLPEAQWLRSHFPRARIAFRSDNQGSQGDAAAAGAGIALLPHFIAHGQAGLSFCPQLAAPPARSLWLVTRRLGPRDRAIRDLCLHLQQCFAREPARFASAG